MATHRLIALAIFALVLALSPRTAPAAVMERDWLAPGDGLLTFDNINNREWLDISVTLLEQFPGSTLEERYQAVVAETAGGGLFEGFRVAGEVDVIALANSAGVDTTKTDYTTNGGSVDELIRLFGMPVKLFGDELVASYAFVDAYADRPTPVRAAMIFVSLPPPLEPPPFPPIGTAFVNVGRGDGIGASTTGVGLLRAAVPEPAATRILAVSVVMLSAVCVARKRMQFLRR
jgi:hypothetical protein